MNSIETTDLCSPKKYPIVQSPTSSKLRFLLTPSAKKKQEVIYAIENKKTGEIYIGKTNDVARRALEHARNASSSSDSSTKKRNKSRLYQDLNKDPNDFAFYILRKVADHENSSELEKAFVKRLNTKEKGYNENGGAGGGKEIKIEKEDTAIPEKMPSTPDKRYPIQNLHADFTPIAAKAKNVVYLIIDNVTKERYVGCSIQELSKRFSSHFSVARNPAAGTSNRSLVQALRNGTSEKGRFEAAILFQANTIGHTRFMESILIDDQATRHTLLNGNKGLNRERIAKTTTVAKRIKF